MKKETKKEVKKLRLSRETLRDLMKSDVQEVVGGAVKAAGASPESPCYGCPGDTWRPMCPES
jgi:hypothetical protein